MFSSVAASHVATPVHPPDIPSGHISVHHVCTAIYSENHPKANMFWAKGECRSVQSVRNERRQARLSTPHIALAMARLVVVQ